MRSPYIHGLEVGRGGAAGLEGESGLSCLAEWWGKALWEQVGIALWTRQVE